VAGALLPGLSWQPEQRSANSALPSGWTGVSARAETATRQISAARNGDAERTNR